MNLTKIAKYYSDSGAGVSGETALTGGDGLSILWTGWGGLSPQGQARIKVARSGRSMEVFGVPQAIHYHQRDNLRGFTHPSKHLANGDPSGLLPARKA